jgi:t-SNARE complex subunit (syntaxin)
VKDNETRAWRDWKMTCYTVLVIALLLTVAHVVSGA